MPVALAVLAAVLLALPVLAAAAGVGLAALFGLRGLAGERRRNGQDQGCHGERDFLEHVVWVYLCDSGCSRASKPDIGASS
jgi:hypothetical protein